MIVGVKYCGGCNPRYDRVAFVRALAERCPEARFVPAWPGERYDRLLVVCGCHARCADYATIKSTGGVLTVDHGTAIDEATSALMKG